MTKELIKTMAAIFAAGGVLYFARKVPVLKNVAEVVTKGYGE